MLMNAVLPPLSATRTAFATIPSALTTVLANRDTRLQRAKDVKVTDTLSRNCTIIITIIIKIIIIVIIIIILMWGSWRRRREESEQRENKRKPETQRNIIMAVLGDLSKNTAKSMWEMLARREYREWKTSYCEGRKQSYKAPCISKDRWGLY